MSLKIDSRDDLLLLPKSATPADRSVEKKRIRKHCVLRVIRDHGPLSRADIAKHIGFNLPSVTFLVDELVREGLVQEDEAKKTARGRRPIPCRLNARVACVLGLDVTERRVVGQVFDLQGEVLGRLDEALPHDLEDPIRRAEWLLEFAHRALKSVPEHPPLVGVGVGVIPAATSPLAPAAARFRMELGHSEAEVLRHRLHQGLQVPIFIEDRTRLMALASLWFGRARKYRTFAYLNVGREVELAIIINRRLYLGAMGRAGTLVSLPVAALQPLDGAGRRERFDYLLSGKAMVQELHMDGSAPDLVARVEEMARGGDEKARHLMELFALRLAEAVGTTISLINPEAVLIGGAATRLSPAVLEMTRKALASFASQDVVDRTDLLFCDLEQGAGTLGSGAVVLNQIFSVAHIDVTQIL